MVWGTYSEKMVKNGKKNGKNGKKVKSRLKKSAPGCPFEYGGGGGIAIWSMPT